MNLFGLLAVCAVSTAVAVCVQTLCKRGITLHKINTNITTHVTSKKEDVSEKPDKTTPQEVVNMDAVIVAANTLMGVLPTEEDTK